MNLKISFSATELLEPFSWDFQSWVHPALPQKFSYLWTFEKKKSLSWAYGICTFWGKNTELWGYPSGSSNLAWQRWWCQDKAFHSSPSAHAPCTSVSVCVTSLLLCPRISAEVMPFPVSSLCCDRTICLGLCEMQGTSWVKRGDEALSWLSLGSQCSFWGAVFDTCSWQAAAWSPGLAPWPCSCPAVQAGMQHWSLSTMSSTTSLIPVALCAFALLSDLKRRNTDSWRMWTELQSSPARAGGQVNPPFPLPIPTLTAAWWRLVFLLPVWLGDLQNKLPVRSKASPGSKFCCLSPFQPSLTYKLLIGEKFCRASCCRNPSLICCWNSEGWN